MSANARKDAVPTPTIPMPGDAAVAELGIADPQPAVEDLGTVYATRGSRGRRSGRPHLRMVSPLRPERASRGMFALLVTGLLAAGMILILVINTTLAQGAFTISALQGEQGTLLQQEQALGASVASAAAPKLLERRARALGMVPSATPVFLNLPHGRVLGKPKAAAGASVGLPRLLTPADATVSEAVDNGGAGLPVSLPPNTDPAALDASQADLAALPRRQRALVDSGVAAIAKAAGAIVGKHSGNALWASPTADDSSNVPSGDSGLVAVPVR